MRRSTPHCSSEAGLRVGPCRPTRSRSTERRGGMWAVHPIREVHRPLRCSGCAQLCLRAQLTGTAACVTRSRPRSAPEQPQRHPTCLQVSRSPAPSAGLAHSSVVAPVSRRGLCRRANERAQGIQSDRPECRRRRRRRSSSPSARGTGSSDRRDPARHPGRKDTGCRRGSTDRPYDDR